MKLFKKHKATAILCERCGDWKTDYKNVVKTYEGKNVRVVYDIQCQECGAMGKITEEWSV